MLRPLRALRPGPILLLGLALLLPGCDNPACVFGGNCFGSGSSGALGTNPASVPAQNEWVSTGAPTVVRFTPNGTTEVDSRTPIVVVFSESMSTTGISVAFELEASGLGLIPMATALIGDGRVLVMLPAAELTPSGTYTLRYREGVNVQDKNGQALAVPANPDLVSFDVLPENLDTPKLITTYPADNAVRQGEKGEFLAIFDRPMNSSTIDSQSLHVLVDGVEPSPTNEPSALQLNGGLSSDTRVWRWRFVDGSGNPLSLGQDVPVSFEFSPVGQEIEDPAGNALPNTTVDYTTAPYGAPSAVAITSEPSDAIGIDSVSGPANLAVEVTLAGAASGDRLGIFLFGTEPDVLQDPRLISLAREVVLEAPFTSFTLTAQELDLISSAAPLKGRFADGDLALAFQVRRGTDASPVTLLDIDDRKPLVQHPVFDTVAPTLTGLSTSGTSAASLRSDMRDLVVVGRASEPLRAVTVTTTLGDNLGGKSTPATVTGSDPDGLFVAQPVPLGVIDPADLPLDFQLTIYDRALNHAGPISSTFEQVGALGPGNTSFSEIAVTVVDATTLAPIAGAHVHTHEDLGGLLLGVASFDTNTQGFIQLEAGILGETVLTVDASDQGYELFSFDGVTVDRIQVALRPQTLATGSVAGTVSVASAQITFYAGSVADSRLAEPGTEFKPVSTCGFQGAAQTFECPYASFQVRSRQLGAQAAFATLAPASVLLYSPLGFLKAATIALPLPPIAPGAPQTSDLAHPFLLDDPSIDPEEQPLDFPAQILGTTNYPLQTGTPVVAVEAVSPGIPGTVTVGPGVTFTTGLPPGSFAVRAAYPGSVDGTQEAPEDELGRLVKSGTVDPDLRLRMQVSDSDGNTGGVRPRLSAGTVTVDPPAPAALGVVPIELDAGGAAFDLHFSDVLPDAAGEPGLYRVTVTDGDGKRWVVWRTDRPDASGGDVLIHLPFVATGGLFPLAEGDLDCQVSLFAWPALDPSEFLWTDVEREYDLFSHSALLTVATP